RDHGSRPVLLPCLPTAARGGTAALSSSLGVLVSARPMVCAGGGWDSESRARSLRESLPGLRALGARDGRVARSARVLEDRASRNAQVVGGSVCSSGSIVTAAGSSPRTQR